MMVAKKTEVVEADKLLNIIEKIKSSFRFKKNKVSDSLKIDKSVLWGKIGFTFGLIGIVTWLFPLAGMIVTIIGIVFSLLGLRATRYRWFAVAGLTLSIVFLNLSFVYGFYSLLITMFQSTGV